MPSISETLASLLPDFAQDWRFNNLVRESERVASERAFEDPAQALAEVARAEQPSHFVGARELARQVLQRQLAQAGDATSETDHPLKRAARLFGEAPSSPAGSVTYQPQIRPAEALKIAMGQADAEVRLHDIGRVPMGSVGQRLVAMRYAIRQGSSWLPAEQRQVSPSPLASGQASSEIRETWSYLDQLDEQREGLAREAVKNWTQKDVDVFLDRFFEVGKVAAQLNPDTGKLQPSQTGIELKAQISNEKALWAEMQQHLQVLELSDDIRQQAQQRLGREARQIAQEGPVRALDTLYLATYDTNHLPAKSVTAGTLKYLIVADRGEMAARLVDEAVAKGLTPIFIEDADAVRAFPGENGSTLAARKTKAAGGHVIELPGGFANVYGSYENIATGVTGFFKDNFGEAWNRELGKAALNPGYGPLAENSDAMEHFRRQGIVFNGPTQDTVLQVGDKAEYRRLIAAFDPELLTKGMPIVNTEPEAIKAEILQAIEDGRLLWPVRVKAKNGGGGRGQYIANTPDQLLGAIIRSQGDVVAQRWVPGLLAEHNISNPLHHEVQRLSSRFGQHLHVDTRDCSAQRRGQKINEQAPAKTLVDRPPLKHQAVSVSSAVAESVRYAGAGTAEFMTSLGDTDRIFGLEMNTRFQVEIPASELAHEIVLPDGTRRPVNLVGDVIDLANGMPIPYEQADIRQNNVTTEYRLSNEAWNPRFKQFIPQKGRLTRWPEPAKLKDVVAQVGREMGVKGVVRLYSGQSAGDAVATGDPTFAKLIIGVDKDTPQPYEVLRRFSIGVIEALKPRMQGVMLDAQGKDMPETPMPLNLDEHLRILRSPISRWNALGIDKDRHVGWVEHMYHNGADLDASPFAPALKEASAAETKRLEVPLIYKMHRDSATNFDLTPPEALNHPERSSGLLAEHISELKKANGEVTLAQLFGREIPQDARSGIMVGLGGELMNAVLMDRDGRPISNVVSLEPMGHKQLVQVDVDSTPTVDRADLTIKNLSQNDGSFTKVGIETTGHNGRHGAIEATIPGVAGSFGFSLEAPSSGGVFFNMATPNGDRLYRARPHMSKGLTEHLQEVLSRLVDRTLPEAQQTEARAEFQQIVVEMAATADPNTRTHEQYRQALAKGSYDISKELGMMMSYQNEDAALAAKVRDFVQETLFYKRYDSKYHEVTEYQSHVLQKDGVTFEAKLGIVDDNPLVAVTKTASNRVIAQVTLPRVGTKTEARTMIAKALIALKAKLVAVNGTMDNNSVVELLIPQYEQDAEKFSEDVRKIANRNWGTDVPLHRLTCFVAGSNNRIAATHTFFPVGPARYPWQESIKAPDLKGRTLVFRNEDPMQSEHFERWRWANFDNHHVSAGNTEVNITEVVAKENAQDRRYVLDTLVSDPIEFTRVSPDVLADFITAHLKGEDTTDIIKRIECKEGILPSDINERLVNLFRWGLYKSGKLVENPYDANLEALYKDGKGLLTPELIREVAQHQAVAEAPVYSRALQRAFDNVVTELARLKQANSKDAAHLSNRLQVFSNRPVTSTPETFRHFAEFLPFHFDPVLRPLAIDRFSVHYHTEERLENKIVSVKLRPGRISDVRIMEPSFDPVLPKRDHHLKTREINALGYLTPLQQAEGAFDPNSPLKELVYQEVDHGGGKTEIKITEVEVDRDRPFDPKQRIRGIIGQIEGQPALLLTSDMAEMKKGPLSYAFKGAKDGTIAEAFVDHASRHKSNGRVAGMPLISVEETVYGADLNGGVDPLAEYARKFRAIYGSANGLAERGYAHPVVAVTQGVAVGGGGYATQGAHVSIAAKGLGGMLLTGNKAAAAEKGMVPSFSMRTGEMVYGGPGSATLVADPLEGFAMGSTDSHNKGLVFDTIVTTEAVERLMNEGISVERALEIARSEAAQRLAKAKIPVEKAVEVVQFAEDLFKKGTTEESLELARDRIAEKLVEAGVVPLKAGWAARSAAIDKLAQQVIASTSPQPGGHTEKVPAHYVDKYLSAEDKLELKRKAIAEARWNVQMMGAGVGSLLPDGIDARAEIGEKVTALEHYLKDPFFLRKSADPEIAAKAEAAFEARIEELAPQRLSEVFPSFQTVLDEVAVKDKLGKPLVYLWRDNKRGVAVNHDVMTCGWVAVPIVQKDGTVKVEMLPFKTNPARSETNGAIDIEAAKKDAIFTKINRFLGKSMLRLSSTPGFFASAIQEGKGIEHFGGTALREVVAYSESTSPEAVMYTVNLTTNQGGGYIHTADPGLSRNHAFVTDALVTGDLVKDALVEAAHVEAALVEDALVKDTLVKDALVKDALDLATIRLASIGVDATIYVTHERKLRAAGAAEAEKEIPGETLEQKQQRVDNAVLEKLAELRKTVADRGSVERAQQDGHIRELVKPRNIREAIATGVLQARLQKELANELIVPLRQRGISHTFVPGPIGFDGREMKATGEFFFDGARKTHVEVQEFLTELKHLEYLAGRLGKKVEVASQLGGVKIVGAAKATVYKTTNDMLLDVTGSTEVVEDFRIFRTTQDVLKALRPSVDRPHIRLGTPALKAQDAVAVGAMWLSSPEKSPHQFILDVAEARATYQQPASAGGSAAESGTIDKSAPPPGSQERSAHRLPLSTGMRDIMAPHALVGSPAGSRFASLASAPLASPSSLAPSVQPTSLAQPIVAVPTKPSLSQRASQTVLGGIPFAAGEFASAIVAGGVYGDWAKWHHLSGAQLVKTLSMLTIGGGVSRQAATKYVKNLALYQPYHGLLKYRVGFVGNISTMGAIGLASYADTGIVSPVGIVTSLINILTARQMTHGIIATLKNSPALFNLGRAVTTVGGRFALKSPVAMLIGASLSMALEFSIMDSLARLQEKAIAGVFGPPEPEGFSQLSDVA